MSIREAAAAATRTEVAALRAEVTRRRWRMFMTVADRELYFFEELNLSGVTELEEVHSARLRALLQNPGVTERDRSRLLELAAPLPDRDQAHLRRDLDRPAVNPDFQPGKLPTTPPAAIEFIWRIQEEGCPTPRQVFEGDEPDEEERQQAASA